MDVPVVAAHVAELLDGHIEYVLEDVIEVVRERDGEHFVRDVVQEALQAVRLVFLGNVRQIGLGLDNDEPHSAVVVIDRGSVRLGDAVEIQRQVFECLELPTHVLVDHVSSRIFGRRRQFGFLDGCETVSPQSLAQHVRRKVPRCAGMVVRFHGLVSLLCGFHAAREVSAPAVFMFPFQKFRKTVKFFIVHWSTSLVMVQI